MKTLKNSIDNVMFESFMVSINEEIINESVQSSILQRLTKQLKPFGSKNKGNYWSNRSFSGIFGGFAIAWDKVTDDDFEKYEAGDKTGIKRARAVLSNSENFINAIVLFPSSDEETFDSMICWKGAVNFKEKKWSFEIKDYKEVPSNFAEMKQKWVKEDCESRPFYILDLTKDKLNIDKKQIDRRESKRDSFIPGDANYYRKVAEENVERYKKIIAKRKAEKAAKEDNIAQRVQEVVNKALEYSAKAASNPDKFIDAQYLISSLIRSIYDAKQYNGGKSYGENGLLYLFNQYLSNHLSISKNGGYSHERNSQNTIKENIEKVITKIENLMKDIEERLKG